MAGDGPGVFIDPNIDPEQFAQSITRSRRRDYQNFPAELDWERRGKFKKKTELIGSSPSLTYIKSVP